MTEIEQRIFTAVKKMVHVRKWRPKVMYLSPEDYAALGKRVVVDTIEVRISHNAKHKSRLYADHGYSGVTI